MPKRRLNEIRAGVIELKTNIAVNEKDKMAGKVIDLLYDELLPNNAKLGDALEVLESAIWWLTLWGTEDKARKILKNINSRAP